MPPGGRRNEFWLIEFVECNWFKPGRCGGKVCVGRCAASPLASSVDERLGYVPLSGDPEFLRTGLVDIDLSEPVNSSGDTGGTSPVVIGGAGGLLGGEGPS